MGVTTVSNSLILGGWVTNVLKNGDKNRRGGGGWKGGRKQYLDFFVLPYWIKNATFLSYIYTHVPIY